MTQPTADKNKSVDSAVAPQASASGTATRRERLRMILLAGRAWLGRVAVPSSIGLVAFFVITGGRILRPRNIMWLSAPGDDEGIYFLSWDFFRHTPWEFPLGLNSRYGAELSSSIALADNIPLLALFFKTVRRWLPEPFQYFGMWTLGCFVLQAWFAWLLVGLLTKARFIRACATVLFVFAPPFLLRMVGHIPLEGQWLLLAALYVSFGPRHLSRGMAWPVLVFVVALVHSYLTAMVLALWLADICRRAIFDGFRRAELVQLLVVPGLLLLALWQAGLFAVGPGLTKTGFGYYRMNVASLLDPSGWSYFLKDIPQGEGDYEGYAYLGLGGIFLALLAVPTLRGAFRALRTRREYWPLLVVLSGLTAFAISNKIGIAGFNYEVALPQWFADKAAVLRTSGRMFWPVFYVVLWVLLRALIKHYPPRVAAAALFIAAIAQVTDTSAGWMQLKAPLLIHGARWESPLHSHFWSAVPDVYREIRMVMPKNKEPNYATFAYFCDLHGMATDAVAVARIDEKKLELARNEARQVVMKGRYAPGVLYILEPRFRYEAQRSLNPQTDRLTLIDGFLVLAPGWKCRAECTTNPSAPDCSKECPAR